MRSPETAAGPHSPWRGPGVPVKPPSDEAKGLYRELTNDKATWVDAVFWMVIGSVFSGGAQALIELAIKHWAGE